MQINATNNLTPPTERTRPGAQLSVEVKDAATFSDATVLDEKLRATADVRADAVAMARSLIAAPAYPPEKMIRGIANLLASKLQSQPE